MNHRSILATIVPLFAAGAFLFAHTPADASPSCPGCNLVDEQTFSSDLVGHSVYYNGNRYTVTSVDLDQFKVYYVGANGQYYWSPASQLYSANAQSERDYIAWKVLEGIVHMATSNSQ